MGEKILWQKALFVDNDANTEILVSFDELKTELKKRVLENDSSMFYEDCLKSIDAADNVIDLYYKVVAFMDDDIDIKFIQPTPNELINSFEKEYPVVYFDYGTSEIITDAAKVDMDKPIRTFDIWSEKGNETLYIFVDANITSSEEYNINYNSLDEAKLHVDKDTRLIIECVCNECGRIFYTIWRSSYSPAPRCEECQDPLFVTVKNVINIDD